MLRLGATIIATLLAALCPNSRASTSNEIIRFGGMCDASAAVALDAGLVAVANDEDSVLRIFSRYQGGMPVGRSDVSGFLRLAPKSPETDLEAAAKVGDRVYWLTSHGRNAKGKPAPNRGRFFATSVQARDGKMTLEPLGSPYQYLLSDLLRDPRLSRFNLARAAQLEPKQRGALNIEGLAAAPRGRLLLGFRNPIPDDQALLVPLENPGEVIGGVRARFGEPILLDLAGLGIRSIAPVGDRFVIVAGRYDGGGQSRLFEWNGGTEPPRLLKGVDLKGLNPEAVADTLADELFIASDDGTRQIGGRECKKLKDPNQKQFRALNVPMSAVTSGPG